MSVTVSEILLAARGAFAAVSPETAGYLVLGAADCLGEGRLGLKSVYLDEGGAFHVDRHGDLAAIDVESSLRTLLKRLLETGRSPAPALLRVATTQERRGIPRLITEIEAALIPVNRAAARRALARLHRDVSRARTSSNLFDASSGDGLELEPSNAPPPMVVLTRVPEPRTALPRPEDVVLPPSTEGPTPIVPVVEETYRPVSGPLFTVEAEATPFLGTVAAHHSSAVAASVPIAGALGDEPPAVVTPPPVDVDVDVDVDPDAEIETDRAPPVDFGAEELHEGDRNATTSVIGTYDVAASVELASVAPEELLASPPPSEAHLYVAIPVVAVREAAPFVELDELLEPDPVDDELLEPDPVDDELLEPDPVDDELLEPDPVDDELLEPDPVDAADGEVLAESGAPSAQVEASGPEEQDVLEMLLFDPGEEKEAVAEAFTSMFELAPDGTVEPPRVEDDDAIFEALPPLVFSMEAHARNPDAIAEELGIDAPATPLAAASPAEESSLPSAAEELRQESSVPNAAEEPPEDSFVSSAAEEPPEDSFVPSAAEEPPEDSFVSSAAEEPPPQESSFGHLAEALIAEALAVEPRPVSVLPEPHEVLRAPAVAHTETAPGLGFAKVVSVAPVVLEPADAAASVSPTCEGSASEGTNDEVDAAPRDDAHVWELEQLPWDEEPLYEYESETPPDAQPGGSSVASTYQPRRSDVADLVKAFVVAESRSLVELARELKRIAGISATPAPAGAVSAGRRKASSAR
jgi:hypothetical protein